MTYGFWDYYYFPFLSALPITSILLAGKYVLYSWGLYSMADHTGIRTPWLAWIPGVRLYTAGQLADRYNHSINKQSYYRFFLPCLGIVIPVLLFISLLSLMFSFVFLFQWETNLSNTNFVIGIVLLIVSGILVLLQTVFQLMCYYKIFSDYEPSNSVLYTILCFLKLECIALFLCRNNVPVGIAGTCHPRQPRYNVK